ncbi:efflux RND transporter periplasmic adaptor subunit [Nevskia ramosa]|uniref:efflux RND transporter periplasmic adaptor subunit n=1 Tax=Nevskia ramosa TaxID=64002 RepID=UPI0023577ABD
MSSSKSIAVWLAGALLLGACHHPEPDARTTPPLVRTAEAGSATTVGRGYTGIVSARVQSDLGFRIAGKIVERLVDPGETVKRLQPLMRIDRTDFTLATAARAGTVEAARARALQTASDEKRYRGLVAEGAVSASAYDQMQAAALAAAAELSAAQAQIDVARNEAGYSVLLADADGVVVDTLAEPGQVVAAGQTVVRLARSGPREATIHLPETLRPEIGSVAKASLYGGTATSSGSAKLRQLSSAADPRTRTYEARYVLDGAAATSPLGATVTIYIAEPAGNAAMQIPISAVFDNGKGPGVWVVESQKTNEPQVSWRPVVLAAIEDETATLSSGLAAGDRFVTLGPHLLHQGDKVRLATAAGAGQ